LSQPRIFPFRVIKWSWGIAIDILARALPGGPILPEDIPVGTRTWIRILPPLSQEARDSLVAGLGRVSPLIEQAVPEGPIVIEIERVDYVPTDYQPEGVEAAIIGWATEEFTLPDPSVDITFDRASNRYIFEYHPTGPGQSPRTS
jgi:hypothetical protein